MTQSHDRSAWRRHHHFPYATLSECDVLVAVFADRRDELHDWFKRTYGAAAFGYSSGRAALRALLQAAGIKSGDEVIVCGFTCLAVPEAVLYAGATPVYADLAPASWSSGLEQILAVSTERTRVVIVQHTFGVAAPVGEIAELARQRGWVVIEDCALALASQSGGSPLGVVGDAAIFSFEMTKAVTAGWGGMAVARDPALSAAMVKRYAAESQIGFLPVLRELAQVLTSITLFRPPLFGMTKYVVAALYRTGMYRMSGRPLAAQPPRRWSGRLPRVHASLVHAQLARLDRIKSRSAQIVACYRRWLDERGQPDTSGPHDGGMHLLRFPMLVADPQYLVAVASRRGFELGRWFEAPVAPMPEPPGQVNYSWGSCPRAEFAAKRVVNLPVHMRMTDADVERLLALLDECDVKTLPLAR